MKAVGEYIDMKKAFVFVFLCLMLTACSQGAETALEKTAASESAVAVQPAPVASTISQSADKAASQQMWDEYAAQYGNMNGNELIVPNNAPEAPDLLPLYLEGLKHENAYVRWACSSRLFEFKFREERSEICDALKPLLEDKSEIVRKAAAFSIEVLDGSYDGPEFVKSSDEKFVVFHGFNDARYNDGKAWLDNGDAGGFYQIDAGGCLGGITISPDNLKLCFKTYGRIWSNVSIYDLKSLQTKYCDLFNYIIKHKDKFGYKIGDNQRPDPYVSPVEWSPDSKKLLLFYSFTDDGQKTHKGTAVYDIAGESFERVKPMPDGPEEEYNPQPVKPEGFKW
jgi:hypothetical protein